MTSRTRADDDRLVERVARVCARAQEPFDLFERVASLVRRAVPYDAAGWILVDPDTLLLNAVYEQDVPRLTHLSLIELELTCEDVNKFVDLVRTGVAAASLSSATHGRLADSPRWRAAYEPNGFGDELRAVFCTGEACWGHVCLTRTAEAPWFTRREVDLLARVAPHVAHGMISMLEVTEGAAAAPDPVADGTITLVEMTFDGLPAEVPAGQYLWQVTNGGTQLHEMAIYQLAPGVPAAAIIAGITAPPASPEAAPAEDEGPPPFVAGTGAAPMSPGATNFVELDAQPGEYLVACFVPDAETGMPHAMLGMHNVFVVE